MARKILLADDSVTAQNMGRKILTDAGYEVLTVNNGSAALKKVAEHKPDLIVLDVYMPGYSGLEVCQRLKENRETAHIPILLTVGKLEPFKPEEARRVKADAYVVKPFEASELLTALTRLEDKIVPQASESQKPGRFAKAIAAFEGGEKFGDPEAGWKNRLRFPTGEKKQDAEPEQEIPAPSSHAFRDLASEDAQKGMAPEFERPLPAGLPVDITPEEIAAITAAAAQLSGKAAPREEHQSVSEGNIPPQAAAAESAVQPRPESSEPVDSLAPSSESKPSEVAEAPTRHEETPVQEEPATPVTLASAASTHDVVEQPPATVAASSPVDAVAEVQAPQEQSPQESKIDEKHNEAAADASVLAALETLTPANGNGEAHLPPAEPTPTDGMASPSAFAAVAAMRMSHAGGPRWIAEPVAVEHIEAAFSLEGEMQKAFAAFAAADAGRMSLPAPSAISGSYVVPFAAETVAVAEPPSVTNTSAEDARVAAPTSSDAVIESSASIPALPDQFASADIGPVQPSAGISSEAITTAPASAERDATDRKDSHAEALRAAAWANWNQIRDSIVGSTSVVAPDASKDKSDDDGKDDKSKKHETEAMAPREEEFPLEDSDALAAAASAGISSSSAAEAGAIANIVDSVLAELRPKIVEEITRKLGNEKKNKK